MSDPALALQKAVRDALVADGTLSSITGSRHYDNVPANHTYPYTRISDVLVVEDGNSCLAGSECFVDVHVWSRKVGRVEAKTIAGHVRRVLSQALTVTGFRTVVGEFRSARYLDDPDPLTTHGIITFRYLIDPV